MNCPNCDSGELKVDETISQPMYTYRQKRCSFCGFKFYTKEGVCDEEEAAPLFREWIRERGKKLRMKKKGILYEPTFADGREKKVEPRKPTNPLF